MYHVLQKQQTLKYIFLTILALNRILNECTVDPFPIHQLKN